MLGTLGCPLLPRVLLIHAPLWRVQATCGGGAGAEERQVRAPWAEPPKASLQGRGQCWPLAEHAQALAKGSDGSQQHLLQGEQEEEGEGPHCLLPWWIVGKRGG